MDNKTFKLGRHTHNPYQRQVGEDEGRELARKHGLKYIETSAKSGSNVAEAFTKVAEQIVAKIETNALNDDELRGITKVADSRRGGSTRITTTPTQKRRRKGAEGRGCC